MKNLPLIMAVGLMGAGLFMWVRKIQTAQVSSTPLSASLPPQSLNTTTAPGVAPPLTIDRMSPSGYRDDRSQSVGYVPGPDGTCPPGWVIYRFGSAKHRASFGETNCINSPGIPIPDSYPVKTSSV